MRRHIYAGMLILLLFALSLVSCSLEGMLRPQGKAEMIVIGMDYRNSKGAPSLTGTINDAREMGAAFKSIMDAKGVPFDITWLVQDGYDIQMEVYITSVSSLETITNNIEKRINETVPTSIDVIRTGQYDAKITAFIESQTKADELKAEFEAAYPGSPGLVTVKTMTLRDKPDYPSKENIEKVLRSCKLTSNDLLIIYYTGHGELYSTVPRRTLETTLKKYYDEGMITSEMVDAALSVEVLTELLVCDALEKAGISDTAYSKIKNDINKILLASPEPQGALITAPTSADPIYGLFKMERFYDILAELPCNVVVLTDACYSGFMANSSFEGNTLGESLVSFMSSPKWPNVASLSASTDAETSKVTVVKNEEGTWQRHSMFTIDVLKRMGWVHTENRHTYMRIPAYSIAADGGYNTEEKFLSVSGYLGTVPARETVASFFSNLMAEWSTNTQTPQSNKTVLEIFIIP